jgi:hypothetical protein
LHNAKDDELWQCEAVPELAELFKKIWTSDNRV